MNKDTYLRGIKRLGTSCAPPACLSFYKHMRSRREFQSAKRKIKGHTRLHLACGNHILTGWANIDLLPHKGVISYDLTRSFPVGSATIQFIFTEHFIEHLSYEDCHRFLSECQRVLVPGGVIRLSTPDLRKLINEYLAENLTTWTDVGFAPATPCRMMNEGMRLWGHQFLYDVKELENLLSESGFGKITQLPWRESGYAELMHLECRPYHGELIIEAIKG